MTVTARRRARTWISSLLLALLASTVSACGGGAAGERTSRTAGQSLVRLSPDQRPVPTGRGRQFHLSAVSAAVRRRAPVAGLRCRSAHEGHFAVHLELYAHRLVVPVPSGIGIAPPQRRRGVYVLGGACSYAVRTFEPTGVVVTDAGDGLTLGALFAVWSQPLSRSRLAGFRGRVVAFVDGHPWGAALGAVPLRRHAEIVLEVAGEVIPHPAYRFPPGL